MPLDIHPVTSLDSESEDHENLQSAWTDSYYDPMERRIAEKEIIWRGIHEAEDVLSEARKEISVFRKCSDYYSYAFFIMRI